MPVEYIAEIGKNFIDSTRDDQTVNEVLLLAKRMVFMAKQAGATVVKFQTHVFEDEKKKRDGSRADWTYKNEQLTPIDFWYKISRYCESIGIEFLTTPMSRKAAEKVEPFVKRWKISSADIVDYNLVQYLKQTNKPIIISVGMSTPEQVDRIVEYLGSQIQFINYCVSLYPCPIYKIDLTNLIRLSGKYELPVGFSDHSLSVEVPALAVRMGAVAIEKHFTYDRNAYGPDHKVSLLRDEFATMVKLCKQAETNGESFEQEKKHWEKFRKVAN